MQLRSLVQFRNIFVAAVLFVIAGCGDDVAPQPPSSPPADVGQPPEAPENAAMPDGPGATFAISDIDLGQFDANGVMNKESWKTIGYNLDHTITTQTTASGVIIGENVCARVVGAGFAMVADGHDGRDNGFGSTVMPLIQSVNIGTEIASNNLIRFGKHTLLVDVQGLGQSSTYQALSARIYNGRSFVDAQGMPTNPKFDGTDIWPVAFESVLAGALDAPLAISKEAYVSDEGDGGTFVGRFGESITLTLDVIGLPEEQGIMQLRIHEPLVTMRFSADRLRVESGTLAGYLDTDEIATEARRLVRVLDATLCDGVTEISVGQLIRQSSDILRNGQKNKTQTCNSISFGIQFAATRAQLGTVVDPAADLPDPCANP